MICASHKRPLAFVNIRKVVKVLPEIWYENSEILKLAVGHPKFKD